MTNFKLKNPERIIIGHININSLKNKFEFLSKMIMILETKLDPSFPETQSQIDRYSKPHRRDRIGIMSYVKEGITSKMLKPLSNNKDR